jgi:ribosome-binding protein aMBF1 (putative translation factor)
VASQIVGNTITVPPRNRDLSLEDEEFRRVIGANIRRRRERLKHSIEHVAEKIDVSVSTMGRIELGEQVISTDVLRRIADVLDTSVATLCRADSHPVKIAAAN